MKKGELASLRRIVHAQETRIEIQEHTISLMRESLVFYGINIKCPRCFHYHAEGHICFYCGWDSSIDDYQS